MYSMVHINFELIISTGNKCIILTKSITNKSSACNFLNHQTSDTCASV